MAYCGAQKPRSSYARKYWECADTSWKCRWASLGYLSHVIGTALNKANLFFKDKSPEFFYRWKHRSGSGWLMYQNPRPAACVSIFTIASGKNSVPVVWQSYSLLVSCALQGQGGAWKCLPALGPCSHGTVCVSGKLWYLFCNPGIRKSISWSEITKDNFFQVPKSLRDLNWDIFSGYLAVVPVSTAKAKGFRNSCFTVLN